MSSNPSCDFESAKLFSTCIFRTPTGFRNEYTKNWVSHSSINVTKNTLREVTGVETDLFWLPLLINCVIFNVNIIPYEWCKLIYQRLISHPALFFTFKGNWTSLGLPQCLPRNIYSAKIISLQSITVTRHNFWQPCKFYKL